MAKNEKYVDGRKLYMPVSAGSLSGSPVAVGSRCGVAVTDRDAAGKSTVDFKGVYSLTVTGITAVGTPLYYTENADPTLRLGVVATALFFGYALTVKAGAPAGLVDAYVSEASGISQLPANTLEGSVVANVANVNVIGGIPVLHRIDIAAGALGDTDVVLTHKTRVLEAWLVLRGAGVATTTLTVKNAANAITDPMAASGADKALVRCTTLDDANWEIAGGGTLRVTSATGASQPAATVYVLGVRVA